MKSLVLVLLQVVLSLAQVGKPHNARLVHWLPPPQQNVQACPNTEIPPNTWPKVGMQQKILPASPPSNEGWTPNQGIYQNWINPFYFGLPNYYSPWGYQPNYQSTVFPRYPPRLPVAPNLSVPLSIPFQPAISRPWPIQPQFGPPRGRWQIQFLGPTQGPWPILPQIRPSFDPFYVSDRNQYYK